jgi:hypothetical protein
MLGTKTDATSKIKADASVNPTAAGLQRGSNAASRQMLGR